MGLIQSAPETPPKNLLPNGQVAPVLCRLCKEQLDKCVCDENLEVQQNLAELQSEEARKAALTLQEKKTITQQARKEKWDLHCKQCGYLSSACMCPTAVGGNEHEIRFHTPIPERIAAMTDFCTKLYKTTDTEQNKKQFDDMMAQGAKLTAQHKTLSAYLGCGVLTEAIMDSHVKEVDEWIKQCDAFNVQLCKFVTHQCAHGYATPPPQQPPSGGDVSA